MNEVKFSSVSYSKSSAGLHILFFCHILKLQPRVVKLVFKKIHVRKKNTTSTFEIVFFLSPICPFQRNGTASDTLASHLLIQGCVSVSLSTHSIPHSFFSSFLF